MTDSTDVVIVGAGPAGCTAAILLGRRGWRVTMLDRREPDRFKLCTHAIMPAGVAVLDDLGLRARTEDAGATRWWGSRLWLNGVRVQARLPRKQVRFPYGLSLRRERLDPLLRAAATAEANVDVRTNWSVAGLLGSGADITGVRAVDPQGRSCAINTSLVVGSDGRHSRIAAAARLPQRVFPNHHAAWIAYLDGVEADGPTALEGYYWHGHSASLLPADHGLRVAGVMIPAGAWPVPEAGARMLQELKRFPPLRARLSGARVASQPVHVSSLQNVVRVPARDRVVLLGDAALQTDPAFGQGISWALQSAVAAVPQMDRYLRGDRTPLRRRSIIGAFRRPQFMGAFTGTSILSALRPGSWPERLLVANAAADVWSTELIMRFCLSLVTASTTRGAWPTINARWREALTG